MNNIEKMKAEMYIKTVEALKYKPERVLREKRIGNWIVTIEMAGGGVSKFCKIYNATTLEEHYRYFNTISCVNKTADDEVKAFYQRMEDNVFDNVCDLAASWNNANEKI